MRIRVELSRFPSTISSCAGFRTQRFRVQIPGEAFGGGTVSTGCRKTQARVEVERWPRKTPFTSLFANANSNDKFSDAELDAFMASIPVSGELVTV